VGKGEDKIKNQGKWNIGNWLLGLIYMCGDLRESNVNRAVCPE
jgi:hypothetical protein